MPSSIPSSIPTVWSANPFPIRDTHRFANFTKTGPSWFAGRYTLRAPFCWTPATDFHFAGRKYFPLYPCVAFSTRNFGWIVQKVNDKFIIGRE